MNRLQSALLVATSALAAAAGFLGSRLTQPQSASATMPLVLAVTALVLWALGRSLNVMTLGGMAAAVGLVIDDATVISEHIVRRLQERPDARDAAGRETAARDSAERVGEAADEFTKPLAGSSLSTIVIHVPPAFLVGVFGAFFAALSLSMAVSLVVSFFVAWLIIPLLARRLLRHSRPKPSGPLSRDCERAYGVVLGSLLHAPALSVLIAVLVLLAGYAAFGRVPSGVMPTIDEGGFVIDYVGPAGASIAEMDRLLGSVERALADIPEVQTYSRRTGFGLGGDINETHTGDFFVRLKPLPRRPTIAAVFVGLWATGTELNISSLMGLVMIIGNVTEVAIFYYSEYAALPTTTSGHEHLIAAGRHRLRAITMTTLAAVLALAPLALDLGHTAGLLRPMAVAIIAGLAVQLPIVLLMLPMLLALVGADAVRRPPAAPPFSGD